MALSTWVLVAAFLFGCTTQHTSGAATTRNVENPKAQSIAGPSASSTPAAVLSTTSPELSNSARPDGWWTAAPSTATNQKRLYFRFDESGYLVAVEKYRDADHLLCTWKMEDKGWRCTGAQSFLVEPDSGGLALSSGNTTIHLTVAPKELIASLEAETKEVQPGPNVCDQAEICCKEASALMRDVCDVNWQLAGKLSARTCLQSMQGYTEVLKMKKLPRPSSCVFEK